MRRIGTFIVTHPKRVLGLTALVTLVAAVSLFRLQFNADVASFITEATNGARPSPPSTRSRSRFQWPNRC